MAAYGTWSAPGSLPGSARSSRHVTFLGEEASSPRESIEGRPAGPGPVSEGGFAMRMRAIEEISRLQAENDDLKRKLASRGRQELLTWQWGMPEWDSRPTGSMDRARDFLARTVIAARQVETALFSTVEELIPAAQNVASLSAGMQHACDRVGAQAARSSRLPTLPTVESVQAMSCTFTAVFVAIDECAGRITSTEVRSIRGALERAALGYRGSTATDIGRTASTGIVVDVGGTTGIYGDENEDPVQQATAEFHQMRAGSAQALVALLEEQVREATDTVKALAASTCEVFVPAAAGLVSRLLGEVHLALSPAAFTARAEELVELAAAMPQRLAATLQPLTRGDDLESIVAPFARIVGDLEMQVAGFLKANAEASARLTMERQAARVTTTVQPLEASSPNSLNLMPPSTATRKPALSLQEARQQRRTTGAPNLGGVRRERDEVIAIASREPSPSGTPATNATSFEATVAPSTQSLPQVAQSSQSQQQRLSGLCQPSSPTVQSRPSASNGSVRLHRAESAATTTRRSESFTSAVSGRPSTGSILSPPTSPLQPLESDRSSSLPAQDAVAEAPRRHNLFNLFGLLGD
jgi:hypothetical protein